MALRGSSVGDDSWWWCDNFSNSLWSGTEEAAAVELYASTRLRWSCSVIPDVGGRSGGVGVGAAVIWWLAGWFSGIRFSTRIQIEKFKNQWKSGLNNKHWMHFQWIQFTHITHTCPNTLTCTLSHMPVHTWSCAHTYSYYTSLMCVDVCAIFLTVSGWIQAAQTTVTHQKRVELPEDGCICWIEKHSFPLLISQFRKKW